MFILQISVKSPASLKKVKQSVELYFHLKRYSKEIRLKIQIRYELTATDDSDSLRYHPKGARPDNFFRLTTL